MSSVLHGGVLRFVAEESTDVIDVGATDSFSHDFVAYDLEGRRANATIRLSGRVEDGRAIVTEARPSEAAKDLLDRGGASEDGNNGQTAATLLPGFYFRIVGNTDDAALPDPASVDRLGCAFAQAGEMGNASNLPAQYTYLGQLIAHDLSHMRFDGNLATPQNYRTSALDLDSVLDPPDPSLAPAPDANNICGVRIGRTRTGVLNDLPRVGAGPTKGQPCIADERNDFTLLTAQMTMTLMKFHQTVCTACQLPPGGDHKTITQRHFQSIVLHDYLPKIVHPLVYDDVMQTGRKVIFPAGLPAFYQLPLEFAAACFRFGHSQVRNTYDLNPGMLARPMFNVRRHTYLGGIFGIYPLKDSWVVDWATMAQQQTEAIDCSLAGDLMDLDPPWLTDHTALCGGTDHNLALLTLRRGQSLALPTGQLLRNHVETLLPVGAPETVPMGAGDILADGDDGLGSFLSATDRAELGARTPLWFYVLREAQARGIDGSLGPLGSRIVMETIHAAIEAAPGNILTGPAFSVDDDLISQQPTGFHFNDMLDSIAALHPG